MQENNNCLNFNLQGGNQLTLNQIIIEDINIISLNSSVVSTSFVKNWNKLKLAELTNFDSFDEEVKKVKCKYTDLNQNLLDSFAIIENRMDETEEWDLEDLKKN